MVSRTVRAAVIQRHEDQTFEGFFKERYEPLLRALFLITGDRYEAEDLAQEAFVRVYRRWERLCNTENPGGYAYRVAVNAHRSRIRRLSAAARHQRGQVGRDALLAADDRDSIRRALASLPVSQREVVVLMEWARISDQETGEILGLSPAAIRKRLSRAKARLRDEHGGEIDD